MRKVSLSDGEWKLMQLLWEEPRTTPQLVAALKNDTGWTKGTIHIMLSRMMERGAVRCDDSGRVKRYIPVLRREDAAAAETQNFLSKVYHGSLSMMVASMAGQNTLKREDIDALYDIIQQARLEEQP